jgi:uncharacterized NAD-dependent epimerase/dehydratase family protein
MSRRYVVFAPGAFGGRNAKTAHGVIAYSHDATVVVVDPQHAGKRVRDVVPYLQSDAPIVATVRESLQFEPTALLIGIAPPGGALPDEYRAEIRVAIEARLEIVNGLHAFLNDDPEMRALAERHDSRIWDLRMPPAAPLFSGAAYDVRSKIVLTVGSDCAVGKMTTALELTRAAHGEGVLFAEGQGGIAHPGYAPVTLALLYGCAPDALVLVHLVTRTAIDGYDIPLPGYRALIRTYEGLCANVKPARVVAIALNTHGLDDAGARAAIAEAREQTGLPCDDVVRFGPDALYAAFAANLQKLPVRTNA